MILPPVDPEIASLTFGRHLETFWVNARLSEKGWERHEFDDLHVVVELPAQRTSGEIESYYVRLGAEYYDVHPPTVLLVTPELGWPRARAGSTWWPQLNPPGWFGLHDSYQYPALEGCPAFEGQLVCFSMTAEYYVTGHSPTENQRWVQGRHTVAATLTRLAEVFSPPHYGGPSAPRPT